MTDKPEKDELVIISPKYYKMLKKKDAEIAKANYARDEAIKWYTDVCKENEELKKEISKWGADKQVLVRDNVRLRKELAELRSKQLQELLPKDVIDYLWSWLSATEIGKQLNGKVDCIDLAQGICLTFGTQKLPSEDEIFGVIREITGCDTYINDGDVTVRDIAQAILNKLKENNV